MNFDRMPILKGLLEYRDENIIPFHTPGHKNNRRGFKELEIIKENLYKIDNTEVEGLDNLHIPEGIIKESQDMAAKAFRAGESFLLVNGSTGGIYSMILGVTRPGDKIIMQRNCHRSVYMACLMGGLDAVYIEPDILEGFNIAGGIDTDRVIELMEENPDARAIILTYPTYYGICSNLEKIVKEAHKRNITVLVDEAHGAHLPFNNKLPRCAMDLGADVSVTSIHKSLPSVTQTSLLNVRKGFNADGIKFMLRLFQSTSPSYLFMASIDAARYIMEDRGEVLLDELLENIMRFRERISNFEGYKILGKESIGTSSIYDIDLTKIVISPPMEGVLLDKILRRDYGIQVEMSDVFNITLIGSIGDDKLSFEKLYNALCDIEIKHEYLKKNSIKYRKLKYIKTMNIREAYYRSKKRVKLIEAEGEVSGEMVSPYPPGIPILVPGEVITKEIIDYIGFIKSKGIPINGIADENCNYIDVIY